MTNYCRNGIRLVIFCLGAVVLSGCSEQASQNEVGQPSKSQILFDSASRELKALPGEVISGSQKTYFRGDNMVALLAAGAGTYALQDSGADDRVAHHFETHKNLPEFTDRALDFIGGPGFHFSITGVWYASATMNKDEVGIQQSKTMMKALSITGFTTLALKLAANNHTPNDKTLAWPSGHTASSFTVASVLDEFYGPGVGIPAYGLAGFVGYRMMDSGDHWASDVLFGGVLGWVVGHSIAASDKKLEVAGFEVLPYIGSSYGGGSAMGVNFVKFY